MSGGPARVLMEPGRRLVIGHRGASAEAPENTLPALALALQQGADALELDVHVTADGAVVVLHDPTLDRTTDRTGAVAALPLAEVRRADAGARFSPDGGRTHPFAGRGIRVPTFAEVLDAFPDVPLLVEVKTPAAMRPLAELLRRHGACDRVVPASAHHAALVAFRAAPFHCGASMRDIATLYFGRLAGLAPRRVGYGLLAVPDRWRGLPVPTRAFVRAAAALGAAVHVWTVDDPREAARHWANGVAGVVTNRPGTVRSGLP